MTLPAVRQEIACSELRPPNTTATRILPMPPPLLTCTRIAGLDLTRPYARHDRADSPGGDHRPWVECPLPLAGVSNRGQGIVHVDDQIVGVLQPDREPYGRRVDARGGQGAFVHLAVGGGGDVAGQRVGAAQ